MYKNPKGKTLVENPNPSPNPNPNPSPNPNPDPDPKPDLAQVLWLRSRNAEHWLLRRTNYTRSLAVMSMVGYILGLGDRHPSNLMLHRYTGKLLHIDFGDCFEVALHRDKFPERVPFRLTRMLVNAMEVSGVEGTYRATCERVMRVLRDDPRGIQIFNPTSMCAHATVSTQPLRPCFENSTRAIDSSKNQPNRRRCDRAREFSSLVGTTQTSG